MPLQNRVDPFGAIHAIAARGAFTGNRGIIHDPDTRTLLRRQWTTKAWIICTLVHPRGKERKPMGRNGRLGGAGWTELFFLDEVTALAAGHRPCFYCRREAASHFLHCLGQPDAPAMDAVLHRQRLASGGTATVLSSRDLKNLPDGAMIDVGGRPFAIRGGSALPWRFAGYGTPEPLADNARLITPLPTVATLRAGYRPVWHASATPGGP